MDAKPLLFLLLMICSVSVFSQADGCYECEQQYEHFKDNPIIGSQVKEELRNCYLNAMEKAVENNQCDVAQAYYEKFQAVLNEKGNAQAKQRIWDCMHCIGFVKSQKGEKIFLMQQERDGVHVVTAYILQGSQLEETSVFNITGKHRSTIYSVKYDCWDTSNPDGGFFIFDPTDSSLYIPLIRMVSRGQVCGSDRYIVYKFNGEQFVLHDRNEGGFWMHPSLRSFKAFVAILKTPNHLIRIDEIDDPTNNVFRYAVWKNGAKMTDAPDLVLEGNMPEPQGFEFENGSYDYVIDENSRMLIILKNGNTLREEPYETLLYRDSNCW